MLSPIDEAGRRPLDVFGRAWASDAKAQRAPIRNSEGLR
jgi:hypothetical protein